MTTAPRFGLEVTPALVTFGEMLVLPFAAMQSAVEDVLNSNPALQRLDAGECPVCRGTARVRCPVCAPSTHRRRGVGTGDLDEVVASADESDVQRLLRDVRVEIRAADVPIAEYVVESLDRHGLLDRSCAQLAAELGVEEPRVAHVLDVVRRTGPPGVGATTVSECLLLQLEACGLDDDHARLARAVICDHLPALARGHFASIATALGTSRAEVRGVLELIRRRLRPHPAFQGDAAPTTYVVPDVVVRADEDGMGGFTVDLVEPALIRLAVREEGQRLDPRTHPAAAPAVQDAKSFVGHLRDRWQTLWRVADHAVRRQGDFLRHGPAGLRPLTRAETAAELGLHESTVSRAVADKYVLMPDRTVLPLARFFGGGGEVDEQLRKLLESAAGPVSDQHLTDQLRDAGYSIARRTVAKHRAQLGFQATGLR